MAIVRVSGNLRRPPGGIANRRASTPAAPAFSYTKDVEGFGETEGTKTFTLTVSQAHATIQGFYLRFGDRAAQVAGGDGTYVIDLSRYYPDGQEIPDPLEFTIAPIVGGVRSDPAEDSIQPPLPVLDTPITVSSGVTGGINRIGTEIVFNTPSWSNEDSVANDIIAAADTLLDDDSLSFTTAAANDGQIIRLRSTASQSGGSAVIAYSDPIQVAYTAPTAGSLSPASFTQASGQVGTIDFSAGVTGSGLTYTAVNVPSGVTVHPTNGGVSVPLDNVLAASTVTVRVSNSGGFVELTTTVTVVAETPDDGFPASISTSAWDAYEVTDAVEAAGVTGKVNALVNGSVSVPAGFRLLFHASNVAGGTFGTNLAAMTPGVEFEGSQSRQVGTTVYPVLFWHRQSDDAGKKASERTSFVIQGIDETPDTVLPLQDSADITAAIARPLSRSTSSPVGPGSIVSGADGPKLGVLALASFSGNTAADARLVAQLASIATSGNEPQCNGGYTLQQHANEAVCIAVSSITPRVWNQLTSTQRGRLDTVMKALTVAAAFQSSNSNAQIVAGTARIAGISGTEVFWKTGGANFRLAPIAIMLAARVYFGSVAAVLDFLEGYNHATFTSQAQANGFPNIYVGFRQDTAAVSANLTRPGNTAINNALSNTWRFTHYTSSNQTIGLDNVSGLINHVIDLDFNRTCTNGLNNGAGIIVNGTAWGRIINNPSPARAQLGQNGMINEFAASDGSGPRSSIDYTMLDARLFWLPMIVIMCGGLLPFDDAGLQSRRTKMGVGMIDLKYKVDNGYRDYDHGAPQETWDVAGNRATTWGWPYSYGIWEDVIAEWLDQ